MNAKIDEDRCVSCGVCANICPEGIQMVNGKAKIKNENSVCLKDAANTYPRGAIILGGDIMATETENSRTGFNQGYGQGAGQGRGMGRGRSMGRGSGRGHGSGMGHGGGTGMGIGRGICDGKNAI